MKFINKNISILILKENIFQQQQTTSFIKKLLLSDCFKEYQNKETCFYKIKEKHKLNKTTNMLQTRRYQFHEILKIERL